MLDGMNKSEGIKKYLIRGRNFEILFEIKNLLAESKKPGEEIIYTSKFIPWFHANLYEGTVRKLMELYGNDIEIEENISIEVFREEK